MKNGQQRRAQIQDSFPPRDARNLAHATATPPREMEARGKPFDSGQQALVVWQILQSLRTAMRTIATSEEAALVRDWCTQALADLALGPREGETQPTPTTSAGRAAGGEAGLATTPPGGREGSTGGGEVIGAKSALTARQVEILRRLRDGERPKEIAHALHLAELTVRSHIRDAIERLGVHGTLAALNEAERGGLL